ncbi:MAG TPA: heme exporter protein CcmD [Paracoccaceae bacterium]|nr:heme exporter protein CcmD [Paracoccaceae bacterium]
MNLAADPYIAYVIAAYTASAAVLGALVWSSVAASRRARRELEGLERERRR